MGVRDDFGRLSEPVENYANQRTFPTDQTIDTLDIRRIAFRSATSLDSTFGWGNVRNGQQCILRFRCEGGCESLTCRRIPLPAND